MSPSRIPLISRDVERFRIGHVLNSETHRGIFRLGNREFANKKELIVNLKTFFKYFL
jgi:hypothetical protein